MGANIKNGPSRFLTHVIGHDVNGKGGKSSAFSQVLGLGGAGYVCPADTAENILASIVIPGGLMGPNGQLIVTTMWSCTNNANAKTGRLRLGGIGGSVMGVEGLTTSATLQSERKICNRNSQASQIGAQSGATGGFVASGLAFSLATVDTSVDQTLVITGQKAVAGDAFTLETYSVVLLRPAA